jgi:hypothetical protein
MGGTEAAAGNPRYKLEVNKADGAELDWSRPGAGARPSPEAVEKLYKDGVVYAKEQRRRHYWRRAKGSVLPGGYDAEGIVAEALTEMLREMEAENSAGAGVPTAKIAGEGEEVAGEPPGTAAAEGLTRSRAAQILYMPEEPRARLERLVREKVRRLSRLKENKVVVSEWEVLPPRANGERVSVFDWMAGRILPPDEALMQKEDLALLEQFKEEFEASLGGEEKVRKVFQCIWDGTERREELALELGISPAAVTGLRRRLNKRLREFAAQVRGPVAEMLAHYGLMPSSCGTSLRLASGGKFVASAVDGRKPSASMARLVRR